MSVFPLPVFEADADPHNRLAMSDEEIYARLKSPKTIVVKFGYQKLVGEFAYDGDAKPGCGSKLVARTHRGTELVEMLTTTCSNSGCSKSVTRQEMLDYIENSGGSDYPFHTNGRVIRVATIEDLNKQSSLDSLKKEGIAFCKAAISQMQLPMKLVEVEPILGGELLTFYYMAENRVDFRELVQRLSGQFKTRIEMRQVGARDEARLVADYERCGQHCCCKNFLKVLKPVSMRAAKVQKATLDPLKISGRCGRLMCCLRYEDQSYKDLKARLPHKNKRVGTSEGPGVVIDSKILVQLVLVRLEHDMKEIAVPVEELMDPEACPKPGELKRQRDAAQAAVEAEADPFRGMPTEQVRKKMDRPGRSSRPSQPTSPPEQQAPQQGDATPRGKRRRDRRKPKAQRQDEFRQRSQSLDQGPPPAEATDRPQTGASQGQAADDGESGPRRKKRRRRRRRRGGGGPEQQGGGGPPTDNSPTS
jgi:cell fate regulator YaaT (PSP1 superfamily)